MNTRARNWLIGGIFLVALLVAIYAGTWYGNRVKAGRIAAIKDSIQELIVQLPDASSPASIFPKKVETPEEVELFLDVGDERVLNALAQYGLATRGKAYGPEYLRDIKVGILPADVDAIVAYWDESTGYKDLIFCKEKKKAGTRYFYGADGVERAIAGCVNFVRFLQRNDAVSKPKKVCMTSRPRAPTPKPKAQPAPRQSKPCPKPIVSAEAPLLLLPDDARPTELWVETGYVPSQSTFTNTAQVRSASYEAGSWSVGWGEISCSDVTTAVSTCPPDGLPPEDPVVDHCY